MERPEFRGLVEIARLSATHTPALPVQSYVEREVGVSSRTGRPLFKKTEVQSLLKFLEGDLGQYANVNNTISRVSKTKWFRNILSNPNSDFCPTCFKRCRHAGQAESHCEPARTRYCCVEDNCYKRLTSLFDLLSHDARHKRKDYLRCDGSHKSSNGSPCYSLFEDSREGSREESVNDYKAHLRRCGVHNVPKQITNKTFVPAQDIWQFWCGFCNSVVNISELFRTLTMRGKFEHIGIHLSDGMQVGDWVTLGGGGYKRSYVERARNQAKIIAVEYPLLPETSRNDISDDEDDYVDADGDSEAETLIQAPEKKRALAEAVTAIASLDTETTKDETEKKDGGPDLGNGDLLPAGLDESMHGPGGIPRPPIFTTSLPTVKTEDTEMSDIDAIVSPQSEASEFITSTKHESELKYFSVEINSIDERRWVEPRYSVEPRYDYEPRTTDEALQFGPMRRSDEPMALVQDRRSDELREAVPSGVQSSRMLSPAAMHLYYCSFRECLKEDGGPRTFFLSEGDVQWHKHTYHGT